MVDASDDVLARVENRIGLIVLNRPKAINSLTDSMVKTIQATLSGWERDDDVSAVMISGAGERGLCAGGDVVAIYHSARGDGVQARRFWHAEYLLNSHIGRYSKPLVALMDGIVMGGGVGIGAHAATRVVTDTSKLAMPEVGIGFIPDVGGTYLLSRAPGLLGLHAALTGTPFSGADAIAMGFADHYVHHDRLADFTAAVIGDGVDSALEGYEIEPPPSPLVAQRDWIDECYAGETGGRHCCRAAPARGRSRRRCGGYDRHPLARRAGRHAARRTQGGPTRHSGRCPAAGVSGVVCDATQP